MCRSGAGSTWHLREALCQIRNVLYDLRHRPKSAYLSEFDWYRSRFINDPFNPMLNNKVVCAEVLKDYAQVPETLFVRNEGAVHAILRSEEPLERSRGNRQCWLSWLIFVEPIGAGKGKGVHRLDYTDGKFLVDESLVSQTDLEVMLRKHDGWFFCRCINQHPGLAKIYDKTSNTIRLITMRDPESGQFKVFFAVLRLGTVKTIPIDNGSVRRAGIEDRPQDRRVERG